MAAVLTLESFLSVFQDNFDSLEDNHYVIALSGGLDSVVLTDLMLCLRDSVASIDLRAVHVNHGLSKRADDWSDWVTEFCQHHHLELETDHVTVTTGEQGLEADARTKRYQALETYLSSTNHVLLTAHHADDQAETFFLSLLRGSGLKGLSAMPRLMNRSHGVHFRPLLNWSRSQLHDYAKQRSLQWVEDESNQNLRFDRNFVRHQLAPVLSQRWPQWVETTSRSVDHCQEAQYLLDVLAQEDLGLSGQVVSSELDIQSLLKKPPARQRNALRWWLSQHNVGLPSRDVTEQLLKLLGAREDAQPVVEWGSMRVRRFRGRLHLEPRQTIYAAIEEPIDFSLGLPLTLPQDLGCLTWQSSVQLPQRLSQKKIRSS